MWSSWALKGVAHWFSRFKGVVGGVSSGLGKASSGR